MTRKQLPPTAADEAFRAEMKALERKHHEAWLAREPGDGLAIVEVLDPETGEHVRWDRVIPTASAFKGPAQYLGSKFTGRRL